MIIVHDLLAADSEEEWIAKWQISFVFLDAFEYNLS